VAGGACQEGASQHLPSSSQHVALGAAVWLLPTPGRMLPAVVYYSWLPVPEQPPPNQSRAEWSRACVHVCICVQVWMLSPVGLLGLACTLLFVSDSMGGALPDLLSSVPCMRLLPLSLCAQWHICPVTVYSPDCWDSTATFVHRRPIVPSVCSAAAAVGSRCTVPIAVLCAALCCAVGCRRSRSGCRHCQSSLHYLSPAWPPFAVLSPQRRHTNT
jgi:hypothetical protein